MRLENYYSQYNKCISGFHVKQSQLQSYSFSCLFIWWVGGWQNTLHVFAALQVLFKHWTRGGSRSREKYDDEFA